MGHVARNEAKPGELELLLHGICFLEDELGSGAPVPPNTLENAKRVYDDLKSRVEPPTKRQIDYVDYLLAQTGGVMSGELHSKTHASLVIEELQKVRARLRGDADALKRERRRRLREGLTYAAWGGLTSAPIVAVLVCLYFWPEIVIGLLLWLLVLAFVIGGGLIVIGLWSRTLG